MKRRPFAIGLAALVSVPALWLGPAGPAQSDEPACTDPTAALSPDCVAEGSAAGFIRFLCDYQWIEDVCGQYALAPPQYETHTDPSPGAPFRLLVGAVHNHSGYSDGDPDAIPRRLLPSGSHRSQRRRQRHRRHRRHPRLHAGLGPLRQREAPDHHGGGVHRSRGHPRCDRRARRRRHRAAAGVRSRRRDQRPVLEMGGDAAPGDGGNRVLAVRGLHGLHRHAGLRVDQRLLQPHGRLLLAQRRAT